MALKILRPKFDRTSYRYSKAFYFSAYNSKKGNREQFVIPSFRLRACCVMGLVFCFADPWMMGAAVSAFYINDAATLLPRSVVAKARAYLAGAYADVLEVS